MKQIWKYELKTTDTQTLAIPEGYKILCIQKQYSDPCIWVEVEPDNKKTSVIIDIFGTGHVMSDLKREYIGTYQLNNGSLVFHAFERI